MKTIHFKKIELDGFGCFAPEAREFDFQRDALNVVLGPNESGKTTLARAIFCLLFGIHNHELRRRVRPWDGRGGFGGSLTLGINSANYRFSHDFDESTAVIEEVNDSGEPLRTIFNGSIGKMLSRPEAQAYHERVHSLLGPASPLFLESSCFINQADLEVGIVEEVQRIISGMRRGDVRKVQEQLIEKYIELTPYNRFTKRPL